MVPVKLAGLLLMPGQEFLSGLEITHPHIRRLEDLWPKATQRTAEEMAQPLRVIFPHTVPHPLAEAALLRHAPQAEWVDVSAHHEAYYTLLGRLWEDGRPFLVIEHDVEIRAGLVDELAACPEVWCAFQYAGPGGGMLGTSLGCTRFGAALLEAEPDLVRVNPTRDWRRLDCELLPALQRRGYAPHFHEPPVKHHHRYNGICACGEEHE